VVEVLNLVSGIFFVITLQIYSLFGVKIRILHCEIKILHFYKKKRQENGANA
jgi:hypothetical protein